jgi:hypothetical protein
VKLVGLIAAFSLFSIGGYTQKESRVKYCMAYPIFRVGCYIFGLLFSMLSLLQDDYNQLYKKHIPYLCCVMLHSYIHVLYAHNVNDQRNVNTF